MSDQIESAVGLPKGVSSTLIRGLNVLSAFRGLQETLSNGELAERLNLHRPTVTRLCSSLEHAGYLTKVKARKYRLGLRVLELSYPILASMPFRQTALPVMREFSNYMSGAVSLATIHGPDLIFLQTIYLNTTMAHSPDIGMTGPLMNSAMGRALLSMLSPDEFKAKTAEISAVYPDQRQQFETKALDGISQCRERGFCVSLGEWRPGLYGAAAPILRLSNGMDLAINCGVPEHSISEAEFTDVVAVKVSSTALVLRDMFAGM